MQNDLAIFHANRLKELIKIKTISSEKNNARSFELFREKLKETFPLLFASAEIEDFNGSLLLKWAGKSSENPVILMNHHDVVEEGEGWTHPAFSGEIENGVLFGRGTLDTKGGLYCMLESAEQLIKDGFIPETDVYFLSSCNEETTGNGANAISQELKNRSLKFRFVLDEGGMVVKDPMAGISGDFAIIGVGEKAIATVKFVAKSKGGHSSTPQKNSPLVRLGKFMVAVEKKKLFSVKISPTVREMFKRLSKRMKGPAKFILAHPAFFAPVLERAIPKLSEVVGAMLQTTVAFTMAKGSDGDNVMPTNAFVIANVRFSHHQGCEDSLKKLIKTAKKFGVEVEVLDEGIVSAVSDCNSEQFAYVEKVVKDVFDGVHVSPYIMTGASDCRFMSTVSENCYRFTPFTIDNEQLSNIHGKDENVNISCLPKAVEFYKKLIKGL